MLSWSRKKAAGRGAAQTRRRLPRSLPTSDSSARRRCNNLYGLWLSYIPSSLDQDIINRWKKIRCKPTTPINRPQERTHQAHAPRYINQSVFQEYSAFPSPEYLAYEENSVKRCLTQAEDLSAHFLAVSTPGAGLPLRSPLGLAAGKPSSLFPSSPFH